MTDFPDDFRAVSSTSQPNPPASSAPPTPTVVVQMPPQPSVFKHWLGKVAISVLTMSLFLNWVLLSATAPSPVGAYREEFVSGDREAKERIAILSISGTIMPPFTERTIDLIKECGEDDDIKGVILSIDSPGGFVADSHQIYRELKRLAEKKPIYVSMKRMAASGGVYVAMGVGEKGKIFAEPTTWTGSIGVIIPRYDISKLAEKFGVVSDSLTTGPYKDSMNPLRPLNDSEREVWRAIIDDSFDRFVGIVDEGRANLDEQAVRQKLATGQVFTAKQAKELGLIDDIAFEDDVIEKLRESLGLAKVRAVKFTRQPTLVEELLSSVKANSSDQMWQKVLDASVPRAMYYCSWLPALP